MATKKTPEKIDDWVVRYMHKLQNMLKLSDWNISMSSEPASEDALANISITEWQHTAVITLHKDFRKDTPEALRGTIIHELLHCHLAPMSESCEEILKSDRNSEIKESVISAAVSSIEYQGERAIDLIAEAIAPLFPLPNIPKTTPMKNVVVAKKVPAKKNVKKIAKGPSKRV